MNLSGIRPSYFENIDFFKRKFKSSGTSLRFSVPKDAMEVLGLERNDKINVVALPKGLSQPLMTQPVPIRKKERVTFPKRDLPDGVDIESLVGRTQFIISKPSKQYNLNPRALYRSKDQLYSTAVFKKKVNFTGRSYQKQITTIIPSQEVKELGITVEDKLNVIAIRLGAGATTRKRLPFRATTLSYETETGFDVHAFTVPEKRTQVRGYKEGEWIQYIVRKV